MGGPVRAAVVAAVIAAVDDGGGAGASGRTEGRLMRRPVPFDAAENIVTLQES